MFLPYVQRSSLCILVVGETLKHNMTYSILYYYTGAVMADHQIAHLPFKTATKI